MRRVLALALIAGVGIVALLLYKDIKDFIWTHPWWHSFLVAIPGITALIIAYLELPHSSEANELRTEANDHRIRANTLQEEQNRSIAKIAELQKEISDLTKELNAERNMHLQQIAVNTQRPLSEEENNARILKKYLGKPAYVTEAGKGDWGAMGAIIAEVNDNNILTLFVRAGYNSSQAWGQPVRCDKLHVVEVPVGGCAVQLNIIERYGNHTNYGEAKSWDERHVQPTHVGMQRGANVFNAQYRKDGPPKLRHIYVYSPIDGSTNYTMITMEDQQETNSWYSSRLDIEKKFHLVQVEWADQATDMTVAAGVGI